MNRNTTTSPLKNPGELLKVEDKRDRLLFAVSLYMGLRCNELVKLKWEDLSGDDAAIFQSKTGKTRRIRVHPELRKAISECHNGETGLIFTARRGSRGGKPLTNAGINLILRKYLKNLGITTKGNPSSHSLRKTFGNSYFTANGRTFDALEWLRGQFGHSDIRITMRYLGLDQELQAEKIQNIKY